MGFKTFLTTMSMKVKIIIACAVIAIAGGITAAVLMTASKADTYRVLKVFELTGSAVVTRQGTGDIDAYVGMNLESGDMLTVCDNSTLRISMDGDKYVLLDGGTVLELVAEGTPADSRTSINLKEGTILNELTTSLSANSSYEVATPKATMAVRGTSFMVSVELNEDGSYNIRTNTFHGKVEVMLLDSEGKPTGESAIVPEDKGIVIRTVPDSESGNPAEVDGTSFFVYEIEPGVFVEVPEDGHPVSNIIYENISKIIKEYALRSNDDGTMPLNEYIIGKLRGDLGEAAVSVTTSDITTKAAVSDNDTVTTTTVSSTTNREAVTTPVSATNDVETVITTVSATKNEETVVTTVPKTNDDETVTTTVPSTKDTEKITTSTVPSAKDETSDTDVTTKKEKTQKYVPNPVSIPWTVTTSITVPTDESETTTTAVEIESFTVSFIKDGTTVYTVDVNDGATVTALPAVPDKTGHTGKWVYNSTEFTTSTVITGDTTVVVEYTPIEYTVIFKAGSTTVDTKSVEYGQTVTALPAIPDKTGHTGKWVYNSAEFTTSTVITGDTTVVAEYTPIQYTVIFKSGSNVISTKSVAYGATVIDIPTVPAKTGYTGKWTYNSADFTEDTVVTGNTIVDAEYTPIEYTVTFKAGSTTVDTQTVAYGQTVTTLPAIPNKTGHTGKWVYNSTEFTTSTVITGDTMVVAEYTANEYTVTFKAGSTTVDTKSVAYGQTVTTLPAVPDKTGHTGKWVYNSAEFTTSTVITGDTTVVAEYTPIQYTVIFKSGSNVIITKSVAYGATVIDIPTVPAKTGYTGKWVYNSTEFTTSTVITGDTTVVAEYTANEYTVTFKAGSTTVDTKSVAYGQTVTALPAIPDKTGHTGKWVYNSAEFTTSTVITGDTTVVAEYTANEYTVTFKANSTTVDTKSVAYGQTVTALPAIPDKTGHTGKWVYNSAEFTTSTVITGDTTVVAEYTPIQYTVIFKSGSNVISTKSVAYGATVIDIPTVPAKTGYTGKWTYNSAEFTEDTVVTGNTIVDAEYTPIEYTVTFKANSTTVDTKSVAYGQTVTALPAVPDKTGHTGKWVYNSAEFTTSTVITGDTMVVVEYTANEYTVTFKADSTTVDTKSVAYGQTVTALPAIPDKTGYTGKWVYNSTEFTTSTVITGNTTVVAEYTANEYTVTFKADSTTVDTQTVAYGQTVTALPAIPDKTGHTGKWVYNSTEFTTSTVITGDTIVVAEYTANEYTVTFKAGSTTVDTKTVAYGQTVTALPAIPDKTGHTGKWVYNSTEFTTSTVITGNTTVVAEYTANEYTVTFKADSTTVDTQTVAYGQTVTALPAIPDKTGHTGKWTYNSAEFTTSTVITGDTTVVAEYTANEYTVTFKADSTTVDTKSVAYGQTVTALPAVPDKTGHTGKWVYNSTEFTTSTVITGDTTVVAEYTPIEYTVTFKAGSTTVDTKSVAYGQTVTALPAIPDKTGHTGKWVYNSTEFTTSTVITGDTTVVAEYTANEYTVTFKADSTTVDTKTVAYGQTVTALPAVPDKTGHTGKWVYNSTEFTTSTVITGDTTVVAEYTANEYTVTFKADSITVDTKSVAYGQTVTTLPAVPAKTGYQDGKWMYNSEEFTAATIVTEDITVEAEYTISKFTVTYVLSADPTVVITSQEKVPYGEAPPSVTLPPVLDTDSDGIYDYYLLNWVQPTDIIEEDTVIPVVYEEYANVVEVKITDAGGEVAHYLAKLGDTITLPTTAAAHENFEFVGWGAVTSGGYADSNYKKGCTDIADNTYSDYYEYDSGGAPIAKGENVTLTDGNRLYDYYYGETNFKFVAVYVRKYTITFVEDGVTLATAEVCGGDYLSDAIDKANIPQRIGYNIVYKYDDTVVDPASWTIYGDREITVVYETITS